VEERQAILYGLRNRFKSIKQKAEDLLHEEKSGSISPSDVEALIQEFNTALISLFSSGVKTSIQQMDERELSSVMTLYISEVLSRTRGLPMPVGKLRSPLLKLIARCDDVLGTLEALLKPVVPPETLDTLRGLREEIDELAISGLGENVYRNFLEAISECEEGHYLASALIASRAIVYMIEQMGGNRPTDEIVKMLVDTGLIPKDRKDEQRELLMAIRTARNFLAHRVDVYAGPDDALLLLGASVKLARIYLKWLQERE